MIIDSGYKVHVGMYIVSSLPFEVRQNETGYEINPIWSRHVIKYLNSFLKSYSQEAYAHQNEKFILTGTCAYAEEGIYLTEMLSYLSTQILYSFRNIIYSRYLYTRVITSSEGKNCSIIETGETNIEQANKFETIKKELKLELEIIDVKESPLTDDEIKSIVEIEHNPKVKEWIYEPARSLYGYIRFFRKLPKNKDAEVLVSKKDGNVIGFLVLWKAGVYMEHVATIGISVHPNFWGKGVATQLIISAIELAKRKEIKRLEVETLSENTPMRRVVEKLGFKLESIRKDKVNKNGSYHDEVAYFIWL